MALFQLGFSPDLFSQANSKMNFAQRTATLVFRGVLNSSDRYEKGAGHGGNPVYFCGGVRGQSLDTGLGEAEYCPPEASWAGHPVGREGRREGRGQPAWLS